MVKIKIMMTNRGKKNFYLLLVGVNTSIAAMEITVDNSQKARNINIP